MRTFFLLFLGILSIGSVVAQTIIRGKVIDASTGDPIPFANVVIKGSSIGSPTNFDGFYEIQGEAKSDTLLVSFIGYKQKLRIYQRGIEQRIDFQLEPEATMLNDVIVFAGKQENPAWRIMRGIVDNKRVNDKRRLSAYEYESYNKIEVAVDNISDNLRKKEFMRKITAVLDSIEIIAGEDGRPILPLYISESLSNFYFRSNPRLQKELIKKTKITGIGIEDGSLMGQVIGSSFQEYNFYQNRMTIVDKEFASPLGDGWRVIYNYELKDSLVIGNDFCYQIEFSPKNNQELAFVGTMWVTKEGFALKQIDATMQRTANLNFIEKIKIQQELVPTDEGAWIPQNSRILIDVAELTDGSAGFLAKFYTSNENIQVDQPRPTRFYDRSIELAEDARETDEDFWNKARHEPLSETEVNVMTMIDTLNNIRIVKLWTDIFKTLARGYVEVGPLDIGPYPVTVSGNDVEGFRLRFGGRTNENFSRKWQFNGFGAYGFLDEKVKYGLGAKFIADRKDWTTLTINYRKDVDQFGIQVNPLTDVSEESAFLALTQIGNLVRPFRYERTQFEFARQFSRSFSGAMIFKNQSYQPLFPFRYKVDADELNSSLATNFTTSEVVVRLKYARDETFLVNDNSRLSLGTLRWPIFLLSYTKGFKGLANGDFDYHKLDIGISQNLKMGFWGNMSYQISGGHIFNDLPYTLLTAHIGNEQFVYTDIAFNTMNFFEFVSQTYGAVKVQHFFEGFVMNRIPLMKKLKWRLVGTGSVLFGDVSESTLDRQVLQDEDGNSLPQFDVLDPSKPFAEVGIGIENIFKFFRVDWVHRLTYLDRPDIRRSDIKLSFKIGL